MDITDTHIHLYAKEFDADRDNLITQAIQYGVTRFFLPNIESSSIALMLDLQKKYPLNCFPMMGLHPCAVKENYLDELKIMEAWLAKQSFKAIGEIGIDLYWDKTFFEQQQHAFRIQVEWAHHHHLPIVIHARNSFDEIYALLLETKTQKPHGIFHCFSGTIEQAKMVIDLGFYLGIGGVVTYKNSGLDKVIQQIGLQHLVLETDAPYLAPTPFRGKINLPQYIIKVAEKIAEIKQTTIEEVATITTQNATTIFNPS